MANVLGTLFGNIASAIREKTGDTGTMKPAEFPDKIKEIEVGGTQINEFLANTAFTTEYLPEFGVFTYLAPIEEATMQAWVENKHPVTVVYDGVEYELTPQAVIGPDGTEGVCAGNLSAFGGTGNGEPFAVVPWYVDGTSCFLIGSAVDTAPAEHTIRIYQEVSNEGGGDEWVCASGTLAAIGQGNMATVTHGLGVVPDIIYVICNASGTMPKGGSGSRVMCGCLFSNKLLGETGSDNKKYGYVYLYNVDSNKCMMGSASAGLEGNTSAYWSIACDINSQTMTLGTNNAPLFTDMPYSWVAYARKSSSASGNQ